MDLDRDQVFDRLAATTLPGTGIIRLMGAECCSCAKGVDSPTRGFVGPVVLVGHRGFHGHDNGVVHIESQGSRAPT
jgi:hypothetical protein